MKIKPFPIKNTSNRSEQGEALAAEPVQKRYASGRNPSPEAIRIGFLRVSVEVLNRYECKAFSRGCIVP